jgi:hypothetical protein
MSQRELTAKILGVIQRTADKQGNVTMIGLATAIAVEIGGEQPADPVQWLDRQLREESGPFDSLADDGWMASALRDDCIAPPRNLCLVTGCVDTRPIPPGVGNPS